MIVNSFTTRRNIAIDPIRRLIRYIEVVLVGFQKKIFVAPVEPNPFGNELRLTVAAYSRIMRDQGITCRTSHTNNSDAVAL